MKNKLLAVAVSLVMVGCAGHVPYAKIGVGLKKEVEIHWRDGSTNHPLSARMEAGFENGPWTYGLSHHSQWLTGWPINNDSEYSKYEIFADYTWRFGNEK